MSDFEQCSNQFQLGIIYYINYNVISFEDVEITFEEHIHILYTKLNFDICSLCVAKTLYVHNSQEACSTSGVGDEDSKCMIGN